jgi:hypothetical protein
VKTIIKKLIKTQKTINAMKKIFLLTLLSVFLLSAFSQNIASTTEIIYQVSLKKFIEDEEIQRLPAWNWGFLRMFFYKYVYTEKLPDGAVLVYCEGDGFKWCVPHYRGMMPEVVGVRPEVIESTCDNIVEDYDQQVVKGVPEGSISQKIAYLDPRGNPAYLIFQVNWKHDPQKPYNGTAEITITKTNSLGL